MMKTPMLDALIRRSGHDPEASRVEVALRLAETRAHETVLLVEEGRISWPLEEIEGGQDDG